MKFKISVKISGSWAVIGVIGLSLKKVVVASGAVRLVEIFNKLELEVPTATEEQYKELKTSVNPVRLKNHPIALDVDTIDFLYHEILR